MKAFLCFHSMLSHFSVHLSRNIANVYLSPISFLDDLNKNHIRSFYQCVLRSDKSNRRQLWYSTVTQATREVLEAFLTMATPQQPSAHPLSSHLHIVWNLDIEGEGGVSGKEGLKLLICKESRKNKDLSRLNMYYHSVEQHSVGLLDPWHQSQLYVLYIYLLCFFCILSFLPTLSLSFLLSFLSTPEKLCKVKKPKWN